MSHTQRLPENHPLRRVFLRLADRALTQSSIADKDLLLYVSDLLSDFLWTDNLHRLKDSEGRHTAYVVDMFQSVDKMPVRSRKSCYKQIGDYTLFILGMFPGSLSYGRRCIPQSYYSDCGRLSYLAASQLEGESQATVTFRKLSDKFEGCVDSLNWIRKYTNDPFYQYMFRQFNVS